MKQIAFLLGILALPCEMLAATITFDESVFTSVMTQSGPGMTYSSSVPVFSVEDITFTAGGSTSGPFPSMFNFRTTAAGGSIGGNVMQIYGTELRIDFANTITAFGFGSALDSTSRPGQMDVQFFRRGSLIASSLFDLAFPPGAVSSGGTFHADGIIADSVRITNRGDGVETRSNYNWFLDNLTYTQGVPPPPQFPPPPPNSDLPPPPPPPLAVPEPSSLLLLAAGVAATIGARRKL
jgi:hypothetical protein